jgi:hypothetical protein
MTIGLQSPPPRPRYWKGYDLEEDEALALELLSGRLVRGKTGRLRTEYLSKGSPRERSAREALQRVLTYYVQIGPDKRRSIVAGLCGALGNDSERQLIFQFRKKGRRSDPTADWQVGFWVHARVQDDRLKVEAAVQATMEQFSLSRTAVYAAYKRYAKGLRS